MKALLLVIFLSGLCTQFSQAEVLCEDRDEFEKDGWQYSEVQSAMDSYLQQHKMRVRWLQEPIPPDQIGRDYYEWLWSGKFGAGMKRELMQRFCG